VYKILNKNKLYWLCQVLGWGVWIGNETIFYSTEFHDDSWFFVQSALLNVLLCIFLTHKLRQIIKKYNWVELPIDQAVIRIVLSVFVIASVLAAINIPLDFYVLDILDTNEITTLSLLQYVLFWGKPIMFWALFYYSYHYFERKSEMEVERLKLEASVRETEAKVLRAQMNPHFMFNALNSIRALILEDPSKAQKGITQLSNILRSSLLADRRKTVSLAEEMRTVDDYLALEKIRYEERLQVSKNIDENTLQFQIPPMLLQTLIENAIKHGVSKPIKGGFVHLETKKIGNNLKISISNTGHLGATDSGGFGLENTAQRLKLLYSEEASFTIQQSEKDIVLATILIPLPLEKEDKTLVQTANDMFKKAVKLNV
jgi:two-component system, LytTR family, sensor kinase